jgi:hypothetical protein
LAKKFSVAIFVLPALEGKIWLKLAPSLHLIGQTAIIQNVCHSKYWDKDLGVVYGHLKINFTNYTKTYTSNLVIFHQTIHFFQLKESL